MLLPHTGLEKNRVFSPGTLLFRLVVTVGLRCQPSTVNPSFLTKADPGPKMVRREMEPDKRLWDITWAQTVRLIKVKRLRGVESLPSLLLPLLLPTIYVTNANTSPRFGGSSLCSYSADVRCVVYCETTGCHPPSLCYGLTTDPFTCVLERVTGSKQGGSTLNSRGYATSILSLLLLLPTPSPSFWLSHPWTLRKSPPLQLWLAYRTCRLKVGVGGLSKHRMGKFQVSTSHHHQTSLTLVSATRMQVTE